MPTPSKDHPQTHDATAQRAFVGLGANLGDATATVRAAAADLAGLPNTRLIKLSALVASAPIDARGPDFVNAVAEIRTTLSPLALLRAVQHIEDQYGRARPFRNAPRTLDLDLLLYGDLRMHTPDLTLPHPRLHQRRFVLQPLAELDPDFEIPGLGLIGTWLERVADQPVTQLAQQPPRNPPG